MDSYWSVKYLLDLNNGNLPVHKGMRQKRYKSIEKMLDLFDILKRIGPKKPMEVISLDPSDPEWEDDMNYLYPNYAKWQSRFILIGTQMFFYIYNYQILAHNAHWRGLHKLSIFFILFYASRTIYHYKKDILRANLFDEYVQMRADELIAERKPLLKSENVQKYMWYKCDLQRTLERVHRQSYLNSGEDFKDSELLLQDFIRRYTDETEHLPITTDNAVIGPLENNFL